MSNIPSTDSRTVAQIAAALELAKMFTANDYPDLLDLFRQAYIAVSDVVQGPSETVEEGKGEEEVPF